MNSLSLQSLRPRLGSENRIETVGLKAIRRLRSYTLERFVVRDNRREVDETVYRSEQRWLIETRAALQDLGFVRNCLFELENVTLNYICYTTDSAANTVTYEIEPAHSIVALRHRDDAVTWGDKRFETVDAAKAAIVRHRPDERGAWAL